MPRLLLLRTSALGDVVHGIPVLTALHRHLPEAEIGWVVEAPFVPILEGLPGLSQIFPVRLRAWRRSLGKGETRRAMRTAIRNIRSFRAEIALDLMGNHKAGLLARLSGARRRIGLARPYRREPSSSMWINEPVKPWGSHAVERALAVLDALNLPREEPDFAPDRLMKAGLDTIEEAAVPPLPDRGAGPLILLSPGAGWTNKEYPPEQWGKVARQLVEEADATVWIPSGPGEEELAERVVAASRGAATSLGVIPLPALAALLRQAQLVMAGDTGPLHLAHALGTPVLAVHGPTDPATHGPYGAIHSTVAQPLPCSYCYQRLPEAKGCLWAVPPRQVARRALELLPNPR